MKPSVPKVVISTDKPKAPVIISKSKERVATKQEQVSITREKVNCYNHIWGLSFLLYKPLVFLKKY